MAIHNFSKVVKVKSEETKVIKCQTTKTAPVKQKTVNQLVLKKPLNEQPQPKTPIPETVEVVASQVVAVETNIIGRVSTLEHEENPQVNRLGDIFTGKRVAMSHLGIDIGTKTVVVAYRGEDDKIGYISEINGWWPFERATKFIEKLLSDPNKQRSDGTKRAARWIKMPETDQIVVLGKDAEEFAYAKNDTLRRPMAEGGIAADEEAMMILGSIVQGLIEMAENEIGSFGDEVKITYCTTAPAINKKTTNIEYHERVVNLIIEGYETEAKIDLVGPYDDRKGAIKESHAIVLDMDEGGDGTGIGISWGAGTVTVSYVKWGEEIYSFCYVGSGDWIDTEVAKRHGYDPDAPQSMQKSKETPTTVAKRKHEISLKKDSEPDDRVGLDICIHYDVLISNVVDGVIAGFVENEDKARIDGAVNVYMAGGTSSPPGFAERVSAKFKEKEVPFDIGKIYKSKQPLYSVAAGCLKAAEMF